MVTSAVSGLRIGDLLVREGLVRQEQLDQALIEQRSSGARLGYVLVKLGFVLEIEITKMLARQYHVPAVDLSRFQVDEKIIKLVPPEVALKHTILPLKRDGRNLTVAMVEPGNMQIVDDLKFITRCDIVPVIAGEYTLRTAIEKYYEQSDTQLESLLESMGDEALEIVEEEEEEDASAAIADDAPVVKLINGLLTDAVRRGASDIHIEPFETELRVRYRIDGALLEVMKPPIKLKAALTSRVKIMSNLNIAERRVPQDGWIKIKVGRRVIDFRVSTLPVIFGEKIVLRILDKGNLTLDLQTFGFEPKAEKDLMTAIMRSVRDGAGYGAHGFGENHDSVFRSVTGEQHRCQHHDGGGSGGVQHPRDQSGLGAERDRHDVCGGAEGVPASGSQYHHGWGDP